MSQFFRSEKLDLIIYGFILLYRVEPIPPWVINFACYITAYPQTWVWRLIV